VTSYDHDIDDALDVSVLANEVEKMFERHPNKKAHRLRMIRKVARRHLPLTSQHADPRSIDRAALAIGTEVFRRLGERMQLEDPDTRTITSFGYRSAIVGHVSHGRRYSPQELAAGQQAQDRADEHAEAS
jgi:hypothetical protein